MLFVSGYYIPVVKAVDFNIAIVINLFSALGGGEIRVEVAVK